MGNSTVSIEQLLVCAAKNAHTYWRTIHNMFTKQCAGCDILVVEFVAVMHLIFGRAGKVSFVVKGTKVTILSVCSRHFDTGREASSSRTALACSRSC